MRRTVTLFRPVGAAELELIRASAFRRLPRRLPHPPIFYPVLTESCAHQIAREWNTKDAASGYFGAVTRFEVDAELVRRYPVQTVGASEHQEL